MAIYSRTKGPGVEVIEHMVDCSLSLISNHYVYTGDVCFVSCMWCDVITVVSLCTFWYITQMKREGGREGSREGGRKGGK